MNLKSIFENTDFVHSSGTSEELKKEANIEEKIQRVGPTLNDVFLKLTGKELRD